MVERVKEIDDLHIIRHEELVTPQQLKAELVLEGAALETVLAGHRVKVPGLVSPGSQLIKAQAEKEGLDKVFTDAGLEWADSGCSMCVGMNGDLVGNAKRCASSTNRNFKGRQGRGARTHLMSPAMVAAAAITGEITDVRMLLRDRNS